MRVLIIAIALLIPVFAPAQEPHKLIINTATDEGKLLQAIAQEENPAKKLALMEQFTSKYPSHEGAAWVYAQIVAAYSKAGQQDRALAAGEKLFAAGGGDVEAAYTCLKAAEAKGDPEAVIKWAGFTSDAARKIAAVPQPAEAGQVEAWKQRIDYAKQVDTYTEYALYATALVKPTPQKTIALVEALEQRNPKSPYLQQISSMYIVALNQTAPAKVLPAAERLSANDPGNTDLLLVLADTYMNKKQNEKALAASTKLIAALREKQKPADAAADWESKKNVALGRAYWYSGIVYAAESKWAPADQSLRSALPLVQGNDQLTGPALFYLGLANYRMGKGKNKAQMSDALKFSEQAAAIKGPFQAPAAQNVKAIREGR
jgi:tetratricopeptide (TPR) repeat protein